MIIRKKKFLWVVGCILRENLSLPPFHPSTSTLSRCRCLRIILAYKYIFPRESFSFYTDWEPGITPNATRLKCDYDEATPLKIILYRRLEEYKKYYHKTFWCQNFWFMQLIKKDLSHMREHKSVGKEYRWSLTPRITKRWTLGSCFFLSNQQTSVNSTNK